MLTGITLKEIIGDMSVMELNIRQSVVTGNGTQSGVVNAELTNVITCYLLACVCVGTSTT